MLDASPRCSRSGRECNARFFEESADGLARVCHLMAERFARGGRLIAFGRSPAARSDARHVAVEFVHPVIVGKRALPAIGLAGEGGDIAGQVALIAGPDDIAMGFGADCDDGVARRARARLPDDRVLAGRGRRVGVRPADRRPVHPAGAGRDALPRPVGARPRVLRASRAARGAQRAPRPRRRRVELPVSVPRRAGEQPRRCSRRRAPVGADEGPGGRGIARADADRQRERARATPPTRCGRASRRVASCSRSATADRQPTRWTSWPTSVPPGGPRST